MQNLIVSMLRFSAAVTLFSMEQLQSSLNLYGGDENISKTLDRFEKALDAMTETLTSRIDGQKKDTLKSITKMSEDVVSRTFDGITIIDPREVMRATNDLIQKTSDTTAGWVSKATSSTEKETETVKTSKKAG